MSLSFLRGLLPFVSLAVAGALLAPTAAARTQAATADVTSLKITPDGRRVLYTADPSSDDAFELFSVPIAGGVSVRLNPRPVPGGDVVRYEVAPGARRAVFLGDLEADEVFELWSSPVNGRAPVKLGPPLVAGGDVIDFAISADGRWVVLLADAERDEVFELYSVSILGGPVVKLNAPLDAASDVSLFRIAPESRHVIYQADANAPGSHELYSVPIAGGPSTQLSQGLGPRARVVLSKATKYVVFSTDLGTGSLRLFSAPIAGGSLNELTDPRFRFLDAVTIHPDGARVLYVGTPTGSGEELVSVPLTGGPTTPLGLPGVDQRVDEFHLSADGAWATYHLETGDVDLGLFSVSLRQGTAFELAGPHVFDLTAITPDSRRVLFAQSVPGSPFEFWSQPVEGGPSAPLEGVNLYSYVVSPDSAHVVTLGSEAGSFVPGLFRVSTAGGARQRLNQPLVAGRNLVAYEISADSARVAYIADADQRGVFELFSVPIGGGPALQLNPEFLTLR